MTTMLSLTQKLSQQQKLTPQQLQYLKLLQLPALALEQRVKEELELNPLLEETGSAEADDFNESVDREEPTSQEREIDWEEIMPEGTYEGYGTPSSLSRSRDDDSPEIPQQAEESLLERLLAQLRLQALTEDDLVLAEEILGNIDADGYLRRDLADIVGDLNTFITETTRAAASTTSLPTVQTDSTSFESYGGRYNENPFGRERLTSQRSTDYTDYSEADEFFNDSYEAEGFEDEEDDDEVTTDLVAAEEVAEESEADGERTIADLSLEEMANLPIEELARILERGTSRAPSTSSSTLSSQHLNGSNYSDHQETSGSVNGASLASLAVTNDPASFPQINTEDLFKTEDAEKVLHRIQRLDPPGIGARNLQECLLIQIDAFEEKPPEAQLARRVLAETFHEFTMKHFEKICRKLDCTEDELRDAINVITSLNPKPGEGAISIAGGNYVTPDFVVTHDGEEFTIIPNDRFIPTLKISAGYRDMLRRGKKQQEGIDRSTRKFLREKLESAKWFIASIHQRRQTMLKIMRAIVELQAEVFQRGPDYLRPMIYKDIAERIGMDISTVCRVVNGKYVQTDYGVFELRYFFSEALETAWGEEVSNKVVKTKIRHLIEAEDKSKPLSDEAISDYMKEQGYNVARRTVAKYREQMNIPVARLRRSL